MMEKRDRFEARVKELKREAYQVTLVGPFVFDLPTVATFDDFVKWESALKQKWATEYYPSAGWASSRTIGEDSRYLIHFWFDSREDALIFKLAFSKLEYPSIG